MSGPRSRPGGFSRPGTLPAGVLDDWGEIFPNVVVLPRRLRRFATWADLLASYEAKPADPGKVLAFVRPDPPPPAAGHGRRMSKP